MHGCHRWKNDRNVMEAILWKLRTGDTWCDVPKELCLWQTAFNCFNRWSKKGLWDSFFFALRGEVDTEWVLIDGSYVKAHQHASGAQRNQERVIGKSRGGNTSKIYVCADAHGDPIDFKILGAWSMTVKLRPS